MYCPKCGKENREDSRFCSFCNSELPAVSSAGKDITIKTSRLAIASFILALLSCLLLFLTIAARGRRDQIFMIMWILMSLMAIILGVISLIQIGLSAGRIVATGFAVIGTTLPFFVLLLIILIAIFTSMPPRAFRMTCGTNLAGIGKAMVIYANDYEDEFPRAGGLTSKWGYTPNWKANDWRTAFGIKPDGSGGQASISSNFYLLVKYTELEFERLICKNDSGTTPFKTVKHKVQSREFADYWDFGPEPWKHCSYAYQMPY